MKARFRVLIDARWVALAPLSSHARYLRALCAEWAFESSATRLTLVGPGPRPADLATSQSVVWHTTPDLPGRWRNRPGGRLWLNTIFTAVALAHRPHVLFFPWSVLPRVLVAPAVVTLHDVCFRTHPDRFADGGRSGDSLLATAARRASEVLTPSAASKQGVVEAYGLSERQVTVVRHGIAPVFDPAPLPGDADVLQSRGIAAPYFLCVGSYEPRKNLDTLVRAFARCLEELPDTRPRPQLVFIGRRPTDLGQVSPLLQVSMPTRQQVSFVEQVCDADLAALYRHAVAVAFPSVCEGFGFPLLESIACGTPAVASELAVFRELVGNAALFVEKSDVAAWACALTMALETCAPRKVAAAAAGKIKREFGWRSSAAETLRVLERAARTRRQVE